MSLAPVLSSQIKCSAPADKEKMNKLAALKRKMQVTGDYGSDSDNDRRAETERGPPAGLLLAGIGVGSGIWESLARRANITCCKLFGVFAVLHSGLLKINTGACTHGVEQTQLFHHCQNLSADESPRLM